MNRTILLSTALGIALSVLGGLEACNVRGEYLPLARSDSSAITDLVLIYQGGTHRPEWNVDQIRPYVSYVDPGNKREHWLFDGFLFIEFKDNRGFEFAHGYKQRAARKTEWSWLLERNFETSRAIGALDRACDSVSSRIGKPLRKRKIVLTLPEAINHQQDWGDLDGKTLNFTLSQDRIAACAWYIDEALARWKQLSPKNLELAGFYWVAEYGSESKEILPRIGGLIRSKGMQFYWIPYWNAPLAGDWKSLGFDRAYQQPNHFFHPEVSDSRLNEACSFARAHGMGLEMEFDGRVLSAVRDFRPRFYSYLEFFKKNSVIDSSAIAYYEGGGVLLNLATSRTAEERGMYDTLASLIVARQRSADHLQPRRPQ
jgi:hypothetical protein